MARPSLRKTISDDDVASRLIAMDTLLASWNPEAMFQRQAPLEVEVGSGKGLFLSTVPRSRPEHDFLGIELANNYARHTAAKLIQSEVTNARIVAGDALRIFSQVIPDACLTAVHVYFPDPWWKKRHHKRRVMNAPFVRDIQRTLIPGCRLHFWTDVEAYYQGTLELLSAETRLTGPVPVEAATPQHDLDYRTHFERRTRLAGLPVWRAEFVKPN